MTSTEGTGTSTAGEGGTTGTEGTTGAAAGGTATGSQTEETGVGDSGKKAIDAFKAERNQAKAEAAAARKEAEDSKKALQALQDRDLSELQRAQKAATDADARAKEVTSKYGQRLARAHFDALAARRNPDVKTADVLEYVDLSRFVSDDGEVDEKAMQAAVNRLIAEPTGGAPSFEGGARKPPPAGQDMNSLLRSAAGRGQ